MKNIELLKLALSLFLLIISCTNREVPTNKEENVSSNDIIINDHKKGEINKDVSPNIILNKTFYYITETDSGNVVIKWNDTGINGVRYKTNSLQYFGAGEKKAIIDSITCKSKYLDVYMSYIFNKKKSTINYQIEPLFDNPNCIRIINVNRVLIDSMYLNIYNIPIIDKNRHDD